MRVQERCLMGCSIADKNAGIEGIILNEYGLDSGLKNGHAYGILKAFEIDDKNNPGEKIRIVRVRNPWGYGEWTGAWNDESDEVADYIEELTL
jgi:hypothetical protein